MNLSVRKTKTFRGMEGYGFNAELLVDGKGREALSAVEICDLPIPEEDRLWACCGSTARSSIASCWILRQRASIDDSRRSPDALPTSESLGFLTRCASSAPGC